MYYHYCHQILYESIVPFERFSIFTKRQKVQLPAALFTCFLWAHSACVMRDVTVLINKMLSKKDRVLIKILRVEKGYGLGARKIMTEFPGRNWSLASVSRLMHHIDTTGSADRK